MTPIQVLITGLNQARAYHAPRETILALKCEIMEAELTRIAALGGHQGELAKAALETVSESNK